MAGQVTMGEIKRGEVTLGDLVRLNQLLDAQDAAEREAMKHA